MYYVLEFSWRSLKIWYSYISSCQKIKQGLFRVLTACLVDFKAGLRFIFDPVDSAVCLSFPISNIYSGSATARYCNLCQQPKWRWLKRLWWPQRKCGVPSSSPALHFCSLVKRPPSQLSSSQLVSRHVCMWWRARSEERPVTRPLTLRLASSAVTVVADPAQIKSCRPLEA